MWGWLRRKSGGESKKQANEAQHAAVAHLDQFVATRTGVEVYLEPATNVTAMTMLLIAHDGEWTRRKVGSADDAFAFGYRHSIPVYEANKVGYPQRMRDYNSRKRAQTRRGFEEL